MTNRGAFLRAGTEIYWFKELNGLLTVFDVCVPRCIIPPLFHISWPHSPSIYDAHNLSIVKIEDVISVRAAFDLDIFFHYSCSSSGLHTYLTLHPSYILPDLPCHTTQTCQASTTSCLAHNNVHRLAKTAHSPSHFMVTHLHSLPMLLCLFCSAPPWLRTASREHTIAPGER